MINIIKAGNAIGLAPSMYYIETIVFMITISYNVANKVPFSTFGENVFLFA